VPKRTTPTSPPPTSTPTTVAVSGAATE
jgi:hypothetical protein